MSSSDDKEQVSELAVKPVKSKTNENNKQLSLKSGDIQPKRVPRTILTEEDYLDKLDKIITKNYFPEVPKMKAQIEYIEAVSKNDITKMRELQARFNTQRRTERRTSPSIRRETSPGVAATSPMHFDPDTPGPSRNSSSPLRYSNTEGDNEKYIDKDKVKPTKNLPENMSIDGFLSKYTSEDNASFEELAALVHTRDLVKNKWLYDAAEKHNRELVVQQSIAADADVQLVLKYKVEAKNEKPLALDNWEYKARNSVLFYPEGAALTSEEKIDAAKRNQRIINKEATRFPEELKRANQPSANRAAIIQSALNPGKVDITGREAVTGQNLGVLATPTPAPGIDDTPLMTWGEIDGTPFRLDATDMACPPDNAPAFKMPEVPQREMLAQGITDQISKRSRDKKQAAMKVAERTYKTPTFSSARSTHGGIFSPAAKKLSNQLGIRLGSSSSFLKSGTPTPKTKTPGSSRSSVQSSPNISAMIRQRDHSKKLSITDNLMNITGNEDTGSGSRPKASDFF